MHALLATFLIALVIVTNGATHYVPANDSQPLVRRDLLPLDVDAIRELADHLALLADGPRPTSASLFRNRVQTVTLSQRLSPAQPRALAILEAFSNNDKRAKPDEEKVESAKREVLTSANWLAKLPANTEGHHLGQLLLDILQPIAENEPALKLRTHKGAQNRWQGVVSKVAAFNVPEKKLIKEQPKKTAPAPAPPAIKKPAYAVTALLTEVPMITKDKKEAPLKMLGLIKTSLVITRPNQQRTLNIKPDPGFPTDKIHNTLKEFFKSIDQPLPSEGTLNINTDDRHYHSANQKNIIAPLAMMLDAAISGRTLRKNTILFADLQPDGFLRKPAKTWDLLLELEKLRIPRGSRIIVGSGLTEEMTGLLVLEKVEFFTKYEVIEAPSFQAARELFYDDGNPSPDLASAIVGYQEVCEKANLATNLNTFLSLSAVENRLIKVRDSSPHHISTHMLATQSIRRPAYFTRFMFAQELDRRLQKISTFKYSDEQDSDRLLKDSYKEIRKSLDALARRLERAESQQLDRAVDLIKDLNSIGRGSSSDLDDGAQRKKTALAAFQENLQLFRDSLRLIYQPSQKK